MSARRGFVQIVIVAVIALALGAVAMFVYFKYFKNAIIESPPEPDETVYTDKGSANWKTYFNSNFNFSFKYPNDWFAGTESVSNTPDTPNSNMLVYQLASCNTKTNDQCIFQNNNLFMQTFAQDKYTNSFDEYFSAWKMSLSDPKNKLGAVTNISVAGEVGKKLDVSFEDRYKIIALVKHNDKVYEVELTGNKNNAEAIRKILDQILSTFKFTADETAGWKTYTNLNYGLFIKIPSNYIFRDSNDGIFSVVSNESSAEPLSQNITIDARLIDAYKNYDDAVRALLKQFPENITTKIVQTADKIIVKEGPYQLKNIPGGLKGDLYGETVYWKYKDGAITASFHNVSMDQLVIYEQVFSTLKFTN